MRVRKTTRNASILGAAAFAGIMSVSVAHAEGQVQLTNGVHKVGLMDGYSDLHAYPAGPGFWGKGVGVGHGAGHHGHGHRHHR